MTTGRRLALFAFIYSLLHHAGSVPGGEVVDLVTPFAVVGSAGYALAGDAPSRRSVILGAIGAVVYVEGHGMHLAANWINNEAPSTIAHLWDEDIGHHVWYAGFALIVAALAAVHGRHRVRPGAVGYALALAVGATHVTNAIAGGTLVMALGTAAVFAAWGALMWAGAGRLLVVAYVPALAALLVTLI